MNKAEKTRNYIIETAAPVFNMKGYVGTSISDITERTGLSKGSIYGNFDNKDELALAALDYNFKKVSDHIFSTFRDKTNSCEKLAAFAVAYKDNYQIMKKMGGCPIMNAAVDSDDGNELIKHRVISFLKLWKKSLKTIIEHGKSCSEIRPDVDGENFSMTFIALIEGGLAMSKATGEQNYLNQAVDHIISIVESFRV